MEGENQGPTFKQENSAADNEVDPGRLFVGGLKRMVEKWELEAVFSPYGEVKDVWIAKDPPGYAFVEMVTGDAAQCAMAALHKTPALDSIIRIEKTRPKGEKKDGNRRGRYRYDDEQERPRLYVSGLPAEIENICSKEDLHKIFDPYGDVVDVWIAKSPPGFAFVEFSELYDAKRALLELDGTDTNHLNAKLGIEITHNSRAKRMRERREGRGFGRQPPWAKLRRPAPFGQRPNKRGRGGSGYYQESYYNDGYYGNEHDYYYHDDIYYGQGGRGGYGMDASRGAATGGVDPYNANMYTEDPNSATGGPVVEGTTYGVEPYGSTDAYGYGVAPRRGGAAPKRGGHDTALDAQAPAADNIQLDPEEKAAILRARARRAQMLASSSLYDNELKSVDSYGAVDPYAVNSSAMRRSQDYSTAADAQYGNPRLAA